MIRADFDVDGEAPVLLGRRRAVLLLIVTTATDFLW